jgi:NinG protein
VIRPKRSKGHKAPTLAKLKKRAWALLSELVRRGNAKEGGYESCYTCGAVKQWTELHAGHGIGGRTGSVLFDEELIRPQCPGCNIFRHGQYGIFAAKLIKEHGMDWWEQKLASAKQIKKWTRPELEELIESYKERLARLQ